MNQVNKNEIKGRTGRIIKNDTTNIPAAACPACGGWTAWGGMSQHTASKVPIHGRTGCVCGK